LRKLNYLTTLDNSYEKISNELKDNNYWESW